VSPPLFEVQNLAIAIYDEDLAARTSGGGSGLWLESEERELPGGWRPAISDLSFVVHAGEVLAIVGESGSGKTLSLLGSFDLLGGGARVISGEVFLHGNRIYPLPGTRKRAWRLRRRSRRIEFDDSDWRRAIGMDVGFLFQNALTAWEPTSYVGDQAGEALDEHTELTQEEIEERVFDALGDVKLPRAHKFFSFPHQMSRGEAQRAMLAAALIKSPQLLVADEPLSGLDVSVAAAILDLIKDLQRKRGMAMILVTHDLATVASVADRVAIMYAGRIIETGRCDALFHHPQHPYTNGLLSSIPRLGAERLQPIEGDAPRLVDVPSGRCAFAPRCPYAEGACWESRPEPETSGAGTVACFRHGELDLRGWVP
jgi:oligopeptide/dipeptide ABC transporter ATP-binding protein